MVPRLRGDEPIGLSGYDQLADRLFVDFAADGLEGLGAAFATILDRFRDDLPAGD